MTNELDRLTSLVWWRNYRTAAETRLQTTTHPRDRYALRACIANADDVIARMEPIVAADAAVAS